jgi:hypothetical protein
MQKQNAVDSKRKIQFASHYDRHGPCGLDQSGAVSAHACPEFAGLEKQTKKQA